MSTPKLSELFASIKEFDDILFIAENNAKTDREMDFTTEIRLRYNKYGENMFITLKQRDYLENIAQNTRV